MRIDLRFTTATATALLISAASRPPSPAKFHPKYSSSCARIFMAVSEDEMYSETLLTEEELAEVLKTRKVFSEVPRDKSTRQYRRLAGSFLPVDEELPTFATEVSTTDLRRPLLNEISMDDDDDDNSLDFYSSDEADWSERSLKGKALWANETYRARALAKRRQTLAHKGKLRGATVPKPPLSPSAQRRADSLKLMRKDEEAWMEQRLASGSAARAFINDESVKARKQKERSEVARKRMAARKAGEKAAAEGVTAKRPRGRPKKEKVALRKKQQEASPWRKGTEEQQRLYYIAMQKAAAALTEAAADASKMADLRGECDADDDEACDTLEEEDAAKKAWLAKLDAPSWTSAAKAVSDIVEVASQSVAERQAADSQSKGEAKAAWMRELDSDGWGQAAKVMSEVMEEATRMADLEEECEAGGTAACEPLSTEEEAKRKWLAKLDVPSWGAAAQAVSEVAANVNAMPTPQERLTLLKEMMADGLMSEAAANKKREEIMAEVAKKRRLTEMSAKEAEVGGGEKGDT